METFAVTAIKIWMTLFGVGCLGMFYNMYRTNLDHAMYWLMGTMAWLVGGGIVTVWFAI